MLLRVGYLKTEERLKIGMVGTRLIEKRDECCKGLAESLTVEANFEREKKSPLPLRSSSMPLHWSRSSPEDRCGQVEVAQIIQ